MDLSRGVVLLLISLQLQEYVESECQKAWILIRRRVTRHLIWTQAFCKDLAEAQTTLSDSLYDHLFTGYKKSLIPICNTGDKVTLTMDLALRQVMDVKEREQILLTNVWLRLNWNDCRLTWTPASYNSQTYIMVTHDDVWVPDITLYDSAADEVMFPGREDYRAYVTSSGSVTYNFPTVVTSACQMNVRYFPFDTQRCSLKFGSWSHHSLELDTVMKNLSGDLTTFVQNNEWIVKEIPAERNVLYYNCCPDPYSDVTYYIVLNRQSTFYMVTMVFPCLLVSFVAALAFLLPVESGEKVSLEITVLLSLAVFLLVVEETLPPASENFPVIGSYFASSMVLVSLSLLQTVLVLNVYYRGTNGRRVPRWARILFFKYLGRFLCGRHTKVTAVDAKPDMKSQADIADIITIIDDPPPEDPELSRDNVFKTFGINGFKGKGPDNGKRGNGLHAPALPSGDPIFRVLNEQTERLKNVERNIQNRDMEEQQNGDWRDIAHTMDRVFLIFYVLVALITTLAFLLQSV